MMHQLWRKASVVLGALAVLFLVSCEDRGVSRPPRQTVSTEFSEVVPVDSEAVLSKAPITISTEVLDVTFNPVGAMVSSLKVKLPGTDLEPVEMILSQKLSIQDPDTGEDIDRGAFLTWWGGQAANYYTYRAEKVDDLTIRFYRDFLDLNGREFTFSKTFTFASAEYMFKVDVDMQSSTPDYVPVVFEDTSAYSLEIGPQIGPPFREIDNVNETRKFIYYEDGRKELSPGAEPLVKRVKWAGIAGRYFQALAYVQEGDYDYFFDAKKKDETTFLRPGVTLTPGEEIARYNIKKPEFKTAIEKDTFYFYFGPRDPDYVDIYKNPETNYWNLNDTYFQDTVENNPVLGWLTFGFKVVLEFINSLIGNWGISIILLTILLKVLLFPLTASSFKSTAAMQGIQPRIKELQEKYKDNPEMLNKKTFELYQKEGVNPLGGCLPMLLQMPILFAMLDLFRNHFELRGAMFIPGWIPDLSAPDVVFEFGFALPVVGWTALHILPIVMVGTQILTSLLTQSASANANPQGRWMTFLLPLVFFFWFYQQPSGLVIYWTVNNLITAGQQYVINKTNKKKPTLAVAKKGKRK
jgi:YidC/Oxa1 family membrane protein insertase